MCSKTYIAGKHCHAVFRENTISWHHLPFEEQERRTCFHVAHFLVRSVNVSPCWRAFTITKTPLIAGTTTLSEQE
ncbi:hypothetical protein SKAU_G00325970 [Synaphobranchus kaupii]|uniref:Uncharacterized protein n=1 Tax=Synaphobranchus kaupii TaxID=118154 RepID=A0A9Q1EPP4_SYNKA|nr:hypothetical protein SKAU_G00325970 [Synaphobranchus kaupii]